MKNSISIGTIISFIIIVATTSCKKAEDVPTLLAINTISDKMAKDTSFTLLKEAAVKAGLDTKFKTTGPFTVFAPDNTAFKNAGFTSAVIAAATTTAVDLNKLLSYHTVNTKYLSANITAGVNTRLITLSGDSVYVKKSILGEIFVNGIAISRPNIEADNGVMHQMSKVLKPATGNIIATVTNEGLDSLVVAVQIVNGATVTQGGDPTIISILSNTTLSLFAPSNAAFRALLTALSLQNISQIPLATLTAVLKYHVVTERTFSSDLVTGNLTMLPGIPNTTAINIVPAIPTITGRNSVLNLSVGGTNINNCNITSTNIMCRNGVLHIIDRVLLP
jgi:uncharacterized surface protein with fasciclin (FAS1) repeats